jgi:hypothetical protein
MLLDPLLAALEEELRANFNKSLAGLLATARTQLESVLAGIAQERAKGLAEVATQKANLRREIEAMQTHVAQQEGHVELNIGGYHFQTSVQTLRRVPHTFFDAYFSGRYAQDVCLDGSIFVDRDGNHFEHVLEYMRDGVVSVAAADAQPSVSLLRALKREFGYYCIELVAEELVEHKQVDTAFVLGGIRPGYIELNSMERYDLSSEQWRAAAPILPARRDFRACALGGEIYISGGRDMDGQLLSSVEKYSPSSDTWSAVAPMPRENCAHCVVAVGLDMYVFAGITRSTMKYDSSRGTWSDVAPFPEIKMNCSACVVGTDIYVFGGYSLQQVTQASILKYDTNANQWSTLAPMPRALVSSCACVLNGIVYVGGAPDSAYEVLRFDPVSVAWSTIAPTLHARSFGNLFVLGGCLYIAGGAGGGGSSVERYNVDTNTWTMKANMLESRYKFRSVTVDVAIAVPPKEQNLFDSLIDKVGGHS